MARVIGSSAGGYATVTPTENYVGQALQNVEANAFKYREEQRDIEAKKAAMAKAKQDALDKQIQQDIDENDKLNAVRAKSSGLSGIDSAVANGLGSAREEVINATRDYERSRDKKDLLRRSAAMNKLYAVSQIPDSYKKALDDLREGIGNGTIDKSEEKRITNFAKRMESGEIVPSWDTNGMMTFDVFDRDPQTGKPIGIAVNNMKGEDVINNLTPQKKFDYTKHIGEIQNLAGNQTTSVKNGIETTGYPNADKFAKTQAERLFSDQNLLDNVAQKYGIEEDEKTGYSPEDKKEIYNRYYQDIISGLNTGSRRDYEAERIQLAREEAARQRAKDAQKSEEKAFTPPISTVTKGGRNTNLGFDIVKGNKVFGPTYEKGKQGPIKGVVVKDDGSYSFSIATRKDDSLNAKGLANKRTFESDPANTGQEYEPIDSDYVYSSTKPTEFNSKKDSPVIGDFVRGMLNPSSGEYFQNFDEYKQVYDKYKPKKSAKKPTVATSQAKKETAKKVYAGVDENGKIIWK